MPTYTPNTDFSAKDDLNTGDPQKLIVGADFDAEFEEIANAIGDCADKNDSTQTGTTTVENITVSGDVTVVEGGLTIGDTAVTATADEINILDGATITTEELNYLDGVTSNIQDQINSIVAGALRPSVITDATTARTLTASDEVAIIRFTSGSAITVTVPADSTEDLPIGFICHLYQGGAGQITVAGAGGVTVGAALGLLTRAQHSTLSLTKVAADTWYLVGDMTSA